MINVILLVAVMTVGTGGRWSRPRLGRVLLLTTFMLLAGCTSAIPLRHPDGRMVECGGSYAFGLPQAFTAADRDRDCVRDFQIQGYNRVGR